MFFTLSFLCQKINRTFVISITSCYNVGVKEVERIQKQNTTWRLMIMSTVLLSTI